MTTLIVWMLITVSAGTYNAGNLVVVGNFKTEDSCRKAENQLPKEARKYSIYSSCVQAEIVITK